MRLVGLLLSLFAVVSRVVATDDGLTDVVSWDRYSLSVNNVRTFIYSAEFHYQRLPVPELWLDVFQKFRSNGFNCISVYFFWSFHSPVKDVYDFETGAHEIQQMFDYAKQAGLYVIARAGPYDNAETSGGGLALHLSDGSGGRLRTNDQTYYESWQPWIAQVGKIIADNQITNGGPVILNQVENELQETTYSPNNTLVLYMEQVKKAFRDAGVIVPFTSNEKGERSVSWSTDYNNVGGAVNVYGLDSYPGGGTCVGTSGYNVVRNYYQWFQNYSYTQPEFVPEFQGGYFQPWGGSDYNDCTYQLNPQYPDLFYKNNVGQRITMQNIYMAYGGTNWGHSAAPVVFTSYDYGAPLRENRQVRDKLSQTKLLGLFTRVSAGLLQTEMIGNGSSYTSNPAVYTWALQNTESPAAFYVLQQNVSSTGTVTTDLNVVTSGGATTLSNINLIARQSKIVVTDYALGHSTLLYSTADIASWGTFGDVDVVVFYSEAGQTSTFAFAGQTQQDFTVSGAALNVTAGSSNTTTSYTFTQGSGASVIQFSNGTLIYALTTETAWRFFAVPTTSNPQVLPTEQIFILGPYLVRSALINADCVEIVGDNDNSTTIEVYAGEGVDSIRWNGASLEVTKTAYGSLTASLPGAAAEALGDLPTITGWQSTDSFPEISSDYDDSAWAVCNKTTTLSPVAPLTLPVLFSSDYGFFAGIKIYRGRFDGTNITSANLTASGGLAFGFNVWLNGQLVGTQLGNPANTTLPLVVDFSGATLQATNNLLTVVIDYTGHDETSTAKGVENPRGLLGASLTGGTFTSWRIQGNAGGARGTYDLDPVRAPMNEGGLLAERLGWHLPDFDASNTTQIPVNQNITFTPSSPSDGLEKSGIKFYTTTMTLDLPENHDIPLGIQFSAAAGTKARVQLFINGYQYGKYVPHIGPQVLFPIPEGVLNHRGENRIGLTVWAQTDDGAKIDSVELVRFAAYASGFEGFTGNRLGKGLQPGWVEERLQYY